MFLQKIKPLIAYRDVEQAKHEVEVLAQRLHLEDGVRGGLMKKGGERRDKIRSAFKSCSRCGTWQ